MINLLPREYAQAEMQRRKRLGMFIGIGITAVILGTLGSIPYYQIQKAQKEKCKWEEALSNPKFQEIDEVNEKVNKAQKVAEGYKNLMEIASPDSLVRVQTMDSLIGVLPKGVAVTHFEIHDEEATISIQGTADAAERVAEYSVQLSLVQNPAKLSVEMGESEDEEEENQLQTYEITLQMNESGQGGEESDE